MKTIEIDASVYASLLRNVVEFGETPNSVLHRLLKLEGLPELKGPRERTPIQELLGSTELRFAKGAVGRFLTILSWLYRQKSEQFSVVERIRGRGRLYFSKSADDLERAGKSVNPKQIPGTPYWVITTTPTNLKQEMLSDVMKALGFDAISIETATRALEQ